MIKTTDSVISSIEGPQPQQVKHLWRQLENEQNPPHMCDLHEYIANHIQRPDTMLLNLLDRHMGIDFNINIDKINVHEDAESHKDSETLDIGLPDLRPECTMNSGSRPGRQGC